MANAVDGTITVTIPIYARSEAAFKRSAVAANTEVVTALRLAGEGFDVGTTFGEVISTVAQSTTLIGLPAEATEAEPVVDEAVVTPTKGKVKGRKRVGSSKTKTGNKKNK